MSYLIDRYKGTYRLKCPYDLIWNDYPKKINDTYEDADVYIDCKNGTKIFHYGKGILQAYVPSKIRGRNILKELSSDLVFDIEETDEEVIFKFYAKNDEAIIPLLKPKTSGACISPFSSKNLPKTKYTIADEDLEMYKNIIAKIPREEILKVTHITNQYLKTLVTKRNTWETIKADMKIKGLRGKEYIHNIGKWKNYIDYLNANID